MPERPISPVVIQCILAGGASLSCYQHNRRRKMRRPLFPSRQIRGSNTLISSTLVVASGLEQPYIPSATKGDIWRPWQGKAKKRKALARLKQSEGKASARLKQSAALARENKNNGSYLIASSKTLFRFLCVSAEHSMYLCARISLATATACSY